MIHCQEHFKDLFHNASSVSDIVIDGIRELESRHHLNRFPTLQEVEGAVNQINTRKASGLDGIHVEMLQKGSKNILHAVYDFIVTCCSGIPIPQDWIDGILVSLYKGKGEKSIFDYYRGITLLESVEKVLARLLLNRLTEDICPNIIPESQNGFMSGRRTVDLIFSLWQIQEKCIEQQKPLDQAFVDLTKAYDTVNREALWKILTKITCPSTFVNMFKQLQRNMKACVTFNS